MSLQAQNKLVLKVWKKGTRLESTSSS